MGLNIRMFEAHLECSWLAECRPSRADAASVQAIVQQAARYMQCPDGYLDERFVRSRHTVPTKSGIRAG